MHATAELNDSLPLIARLLVEKDLLRPNQLDELRELHSHDASPIDTVLVKKGFVSDHAIAQTYAEYLSTPFFDLRANPPFIDCSLAGLLPEKLCRDQLIVPVACLEQTLYVAFASPNEMLIIDEVQLLTGMTVQPVIAARSVIEGLIEAMYSGKASANSFMSQSEEFEEVEDKNVENVEDENDSNEVLHLDQPPPPGATAA